MTTTVLMTTVEMVYDKDRNKIVLLLDVPLGNNTGDFPKDFVKTSILLEIERALDEAL